MWNLQLDIFNISNANVLFLLVHNILEVELHNSMKKEERIHVAKCKFINANSYAVEERSVTSASNIENLYIKSSSDKDFR